MRKMAINVDYEYGNLKEVIVGVSWGISPSIKAHWFEDAIKVLPEDEAEYARKTAGLLWKDMINPKTLKSEYEMLEEENNELIKVLEKLGVKVYRTKEFTKEYIIENFGREALTNGVSQNFPRDNLAIIKNNLIELNLRTPIRRVDIDGFRELFHEKCDEHVKWFSMPHTPLLGDVDNNNPLLEGGDIIVLGDTIFVGNSQNPSVGSNMAGYRWLKNILGNEYDVIDVPLIEEILHLDCVLSVPRDGLAIVCKEGFVNGIPKYFKDWDLIEIPLKEAKRLAVNGLPVDSENYIMSYNDHVKNDFIKEELEKRGITVHPVYFRTHNGQGGSIRCATQALKREIKE